MEHVDVPSFQGGLRIEKLGSWLVRLVPAEVAQTNGVSELHGSSKQSRICVCNSVAVPEMKSGFKPPAGSVLVLHQESSAAALLAASSTCSHGLQLRSRSPPSPPPFALL